MMKRERNGAAVKKDAGKPFDMNRYEKRALALTISYFGWNYHGVALQLHSDKNGGSVDTVEARLVDALQRTRLIGSLEDAHFGRCGRTDRGVSSAGNVFSLLVRSNWRLPADAQPPVIDVNGAPTALPRAIYADGPDTTPESRTRDEIDYVSVLNRALPEDIRVLHAATVPAGFHARFSTREREYRFLFVSGSLNYEEMHRAAQYLVGTHDFRNLAKMDVVNVSNYVRTVLSADVQPAALEGVSAHPDAPLYELRLRGYAFLYHQVRHIAQVLERVGRQLEPPEVVRDLLDLGKYPRKPSYGMASDLPLNLYRCGYDFDVNQGGTGAKAKLAEVLFSQWRELVLRQAHVVMAMERAGISLAEAEHHYNSSQRQLIGPMPQLPTEESYEEKLLSIQQKRAKCLLE